MHRFDRWRDTIRAASSAEAVEAVLREYVASIPPGVVAALPKGCQAALREGDVQSAALTLVQADLAFAGPGELSQLLHEIAQTYAAASMRIAKLKVQSP